MDLGALIGIASGGIAAIDRGLGAVGQNVANAGTPDWVREVAERSSVAADGVGMGVRSLPASRAVDSALQASSFAQNGIVAGLQTRQAARSSIDAVQGKVGDGADLASLVGALRDTFETLAGDPSNQTQQRGVVAAASSVARQINALAGAVGAARQTAQDSAVQQVASVNADLSRVGVLSRQIVRLGASGQSTADAENQRDAAIDRIGRVLPLRVLGQTNGDVILATPSGLTLPTSGGSPLSLASATLGPTATYPASPSVPGLLLNGLDVTSRMRGDGELGANLALRDTTLPAYQATLDEFAQTLATRFDDQGLTLFTDAAGIVPTATGPFAQSGYVGFASEIAVNPTVLGSPSLVRDGTRAVAGSAAGAGSFTPNPAGGPAGFTGTIERVVDFAFGAEAQTGVPQAGPSTTGLGPGGDLAVGFAPATNLPAFAASLVGQMAQDGSKTGTELDTATALQTSLQAKLTSGSGVSIDAEMSTMLQLQNAYGANAKVITAVQTMWDALMATIR